MSKHPLLKKLKGVQQWQVFCSNNPVCAKKTKEKLGELLTENLLSKEIETLPIDNSPETKKDFQPKEGKRPDFLVTLKDKSMLFIDAKCHNIKGSNFVFYISEDEYCKYKETARYYDEGIVFSIVDWNYPSEMAFVLLCDLEKKNNRYEIKFSDLEKIVIEEEDYINVCQELGKIGYNTLPPYAKKGDS